VKIFAIVKSSLLTAALAVAVVVAVPSYAHEVIYGATFSGAAESPANSSPGTGSALITFDMDLFTMRVQASFSGLLGPTSAAHIHCCTVNPGVLNAGVATITPSFTGFPLGVQGGTYDHTFDMTLAGSYNTPFRNANGGTASTAFNALLNGINQGRAYFNIHTALPLGFPGGEIRGFLQPVPEPETYALLLAGLGLMALTAARRKRG